MATDATVTAVQAEMQKGAKLRLLIVVVIVLVFIVGLVTTVLGSIAYHRFTRNDTPHYASDVNHFKYGSIGSEPDSGLPYWVWQALPSLYPEVFKGSDYRVFGFVYENDDQGRKRDLPVGVSRRSVNGVDLVWLNCAVTTPAPCATPLSRRRASLRRCRRTTWTCTVS